MQLKGFEARAAKLQATARTFDQALAEMSTLEGPSRLNPSLYARWKKLLTDGISIRESVDSTGKMIASARSWFNRTFQTEALDAVPFAPDALKGAINGAVSAMEHWLDAFSAFARDIETLRQRWLKIPPEERSRLPVPQIGEIERGTSNPVFGLALIAALGAVAWFGPRFMESEENE
jgi:hypothetical protein